MQVAPKYWGRTSSLFNKNNVEIHRIEANAGGFSSEHKHTSKFNMFIVESGQLEVSVWTDSGDKPDVGIVRPGETCIVRPGFYHKFKAVTDCVVYEVYWTELCTDDIQRRTSGGPNSSLEG